MNPAFKVSFWDAKSGIRAKDEITHAASDTAALMQVIHRVFSKKDPKFIKANGGLIIWRILNKKDNSNYKSIPVTFDKFKNQYVTEKFSNFFRKMS